MSALDGTALLDLATRAVLAAILVFAGMAKLRDPKTTARLVHEFGVSFIGAASITAIALPSAEIVIGLALLVPQLALSASLLASCLFLIFTVGNSIAIARGKNLVCGCFGKLKQERISLLTVSRSALFFGASFLVVSTNAGRNGYFQVDLSSAVILTLTSLGTLLAIAGFVLAFWLTGGEERERGYSAASYSRRHMLKLLGGIAAALTLTPVKPALALCCKCQEYRHFDPFCCTGNFFHIRHYFKRCCNTCSGQVGGWHHYAPNGCECECAEPVNTCGDFIFSCTGDACYINECGCAV